VSMKIRATLPFLLTVLSLAGCVTINIYFPAAAAEKAADKIIDEVWQAQPGQQDSPKGSEAKPESQPQAQPDAGKETK
jgi:hypothetical protein